MLAKILFVVKGELIDDALDDGENAILVLETEILNHLLEQRLNSIHLKKCGKYQNEIFQYFLIMTLDRKRFAATTSVFSVRIIKNKTFTI